MQPGAVIDQRYGVEAAQPLDGWVIPRSNLRLGMDYEAGCCLAVSDLGTPDLEWLRLFELPLDCATVFVLRIGP
ncbi:hypothetical protein N7541_006625 [Penicillium brevicompactum]|uniref:Uncharacterized protein n=1 Tax=Penicillium brevicompactum TaxID=5074 RepID=A0A9W9R5H6_PENBR|nr:hypothetical protein N7541_006625 [Penicillium brevicompactum]